MRSSVLTGLLLASAWACSDEANDPSPGAAGSGGDAHQGGVGHGGTSGNHTGGNVSGGGISVGTAGGAAETSMGGIVGTAQAGEAGQAGARGGAENEAGAGGAVVAEGGGAGVGGEGGANDTDPQPVVCTEDQIKLVGDSRCFECPGPVYEEYAHASVALEGGLNDVYSPSDHYYDAATHRLHLRSGSGLPQPMSWRFGQIQATFATPQQENACHATPSYSVQGADLIVDLSQYVACVGLSQVFATDIFPNVGCADPLRFPGGISLSFATNPAVLSIASNNPGTLPPIMFGEYVPVPHPPRFTTGGVVTDSMTGLVWEQRAAGDYPELPQAAAVTHCTDLETAGFSDWRLPSAYELFTLIQVSASSEQKLIDLQAFPATPLAGFWSSSVWAADASTSWWVDFGANDIDFALDDSMDPSTSLFTRCVRGGVTPAQRFTVNFGAGTVLDNVTGLTWERAPSLSKRTPAAAHAYCRDLSLAGGGWREPSVYELMSLLDFTKRKPAIDTTAFPETPSAGAYWSSSPARRGAARRGWAVEFLDSPPFLGDWLTQEYVRCVR